MPGWYIHMEAARRAAERLESGAVPSAFPGGAAHATDLGNQAHTWRNYLALGAIGPDIFFLLPDYKAGTGAVLLHVVEWVRDVYEWLDDSFLSKWEKWAAPAITGAGDILNQLTGDVLAELGQAMQELAGAIQNAIIDLLTKLWDWFGLLTSGVPQGFDESAFFWSDIFHYRKTYEFAQKLFENATTDQHRAFALGWMSHCATDVTGHAFVNEKCGGPYRLHWQRHHLIENHMDALVYNDEHGAEPYGEFATSALHFRLAFRHRTDAPYNGANDAPAYDYFAGLPAYDPSPGGDFFRKHLWDLDSGDLPDDLADLITSTMKQVYYDPLPGGAPPLSTRDAPQILTDDPSFNDAGTGRPNKKTIQNTFWTLYHYLKFVTTDGYSPRHPTPPDVLDDHSPPPFPGSDGGVSDDPSRGDDPGSSDDWNLLDLLLALFAFAAYIAELGIWLATLPIAIVNDILSYPARVVLYELAVVPMWNLYMATRKPLVMTGFLVPKPEEISRGLVELGISPTGGLQDLASALASPTGTPSGFVPFDEPSGRPSAGSEWEMDTAYPRAIVTDTPTLIENVVGFLDPSHFCVQPFSPIPPQPSEFVSPWRYPATNNAGQINGWEPALSHAGPYVQGQDARVLMGNAPGDDTARTEYEKAPDPDATEGVSHARLPLDQHLGDPIDYSVYVMGALSSGRAIPDFNLDADRGYAFHCWEFDRMPAPGWQPSSLGDVKYQFNQPCTVPEGFCQVGGPMYNPFVHLAIHYGEQGDGCKDPVRVGWGSPEVNQAGILPNGQRG